MKILKICVIVLGLAAMPAAAEQASELAGTPGQGFPPNPDDPVWAAPDQGVLYDNGPLVNSAGTGAGGADESQLQGSLGMSTLGFGHQTSAGNTIADDFTIPAGQTWDITAWTFFAYQTGSSTSSTMTQLFVQIWDGPPNGGGSVIAGNLTTNVLASTAFSNIYRVTDTTSGATNRPIMSQTANVALSLGEGTYWIEWQTDGSLTSGPWAPPITINGLTTTGNALQWTGSWGPANDNSSATQQGFPFIIEGTIQGSGGGGGGGGGGGTGAPGEPIPTLSNAGILILVLALIGISAVLIRRRM